MITLLLLLLGVLLILFTGVPIFSGLGSMSIAILYFTEGQVGSMGDLVFGKLNMYLLVAIPLFAFMAEVLIKARVVDDLYDAMHLMVRHLPGGLNVATILSCTLFAAISGSSAATALTIGATAIPQMKRYGYPPRMAYGAVAAGGTLGILIPPSAPMILYGVVADASIGAMFIGGIIPGIIISGMFSGFCFFQALFNKELKRPPRAPLREVARAMRKAIWPMLLPPLILGGMYMGVFTATEGAGAGALAAVLISWLVYRQLTWATLYEAAYKAGRLTCVLLMILVAAAMFSHVMTMMRLPAMLIENVIQLGLGQTSFLLVLMATIFILGMFLESISIILITTPIVLPVLISLDVNLVWYGVLLMVNLEMAMITPPVGMNLFVIKSIANAPIREIIVGAAPFVVWMLVGLAMVMIFPEIVLWLPRQLGFG